MAPNGTVPLRARLNALSALGERLDRAPAERLSHEALAAVVPELNLQAGWVFLVDDDGAAERHAEPSFVAGYGLPPALAADGACALRSGACECLARWSAGRLEHGVNVVTCSRLAKAEGDRNGLVRHASVPVRGVRGSIGVLNLAAGGDHAFGADDLAFLDVVGRQLGAAIQRVRLARDAERSARAEAAAAERARLAADVHDALSNLLFAAQLQARLAADGDDAALDRLEAVLHDARGELRGWIDATRTPDLGGGLIPALARLAERMAPDVTVRIDDAVHAGDASGTDATSERRSALALLRTAEEAVHNAVRHGGASEVRISVERPHAGAIRLVIDDDGRGCDPVAAAAGPGLRGVRARLERAGGGLRIESARLGGLRLIATVGSGG